MNRHIFNFVFCCVFSVQFSFAQKLEKIYDSPSNSKVGNMDEYSFKAYSMGAWMNTNIKLANKSLVVEYPGKGDSITFDFIHYTGKTIKNLKIIKTDVEGEPCRYISDSARLIVINAKNGINNIQVYDVNTGTLVQTIKFSTELGDLFEKNKAKNRLEEYDIFRKNKSHYISHSDMYDNKLLIYLLTFYNPVEKGIPEALTPVWVDLSKPGDLDIVFPEFPALNDFQHKRVYQLWDFKRYDDSRLFIYSRRYLLDKGPKKGNALTIAEFDDDGKLIRSIDVDLEIAEHNEFHTYLKYRYAAELKYDGSEKVFYLISSVKSDKKINGNDRALILKKIDLYGKVIWEKIYFESEFFPHGGTFSTYGVRLPAIDFDPEDKTVSINIMNDYSTFSYITFSSINAEFLKIHHKPLKEYILSAEVYLPPFGALINKEMEINKYKNYLVRDKIVLFKTANDGYAGYIYK